MPNQSTIGDVKFDHLVTVLTLRCFCCNDIFPFHLVICVVIFWHCVNIMFLITLHLTVLGWFFFFLIILAGISCYIEDYRRMLFYFQYLFTFISFGTLDAILGVRVLSLMQTEVSGDFMQGNLENWERPQAFYKIFTKILELQYYLLRLPVETATLSGNNSS